MDYSATKKVFIFIDESGDVGDPRVHTSSSKEFTINLGVATEEGVNNMNLLISGFNFFNNHKKELKKFKGEHLHAFAEKLIYLSDVVFYSMTVDKENYVGPYLRDNTYSKKNTMWFRNFILKKSLEHVAISEDLFSLEKPIELVIDRYTDNKDASDNIRDYLSGNYPKNSNQRIGINLPKILPTNIVQVDSRYCPQIQLLDVIQKIKTEKYVKRFYKPIPTPPSLENERGPDVPWGPEPLPTTVV